MFHLPPLIIEALLQLQVKPLLFFLPVPQILYQRLEMLPFLLEVLEELNDFVQLLLLSSKGFLLGIQLSFQTIVLEACQN